MNKTRVSVAHFQIEVSRKIFRLKKLVNLLTVSDVLNYDICSRDFLFYIYIFQSFKVQIHPPN